MRHFYLSVMLVFILVPPGCAQRFMGGVTLDVIQFTGATAIGFQAEQQLGRSNFYAHWHYAVGMNSDGGFFASGNAYIPMFRNLFPDIGSNPKTLVGALALLALPLALPTGLTYYMPGASNRFRNGVFFNPFRLDYSELVDVNYAVWIVDAGPKMIYYRKNVLFVATAQVGYGTHVGEVTPMSRNGWYITASIGILLPGE